MLRAFIAPVFALITALAGCMPVMAGQVDEIAATLRLSDVFEVISAEGEGYGREIDDTMMDGAGGAAWAEAVRQIYAPDRLLPEITAALEVALARRRADPGPAMAFIGSDLGQKVTALEISARRALLDPDVEDASRLKLDEMRSDADPRLSLIESLVVANDLIESNVTSDLNANYAFYQGLRDSGAIGPEMTDDDVVAEVWSQESVIRQETETWVYSYLAMAYAPLSDDELRRCIEVSQQASAQALNRVVSDAYADVFSKVSRQLGRAAGTVLAGQNL